MKNNKKILIAVSGGVDSSVAAMLLKQKGHKIVGVFLKMSKNYDKSALQNAKKVCAKLDIPFYSCDVSKEFKKQVIDYFISEYESGRTPNPCVVCNKKIKFFKLLKIVEKMGCHKVATGHYAQIKCKAQNTKRKITTQNSKFYQLYKAKDKTKDQSYFLWQLNQNQLSKIIFPLGDYKKSEVIKLAKKYKLPVNYQSESQDVCFIKTDIGRFLSKWSKKLNKTGNIVDKDGNILGKHKGLCYYTIGQRKGLNSISPSNSLHFGGQAAGRHIAYCKSQINKRIAISHKPKYVIKLNISKNQLVVGKEKDLYSKILEADKINWLSDEKIKSGLVYQAKIRYRHKPSNCHIVILSNRKRIRVEFEKPQRAITPGQSIVFYQKDQLLGGGIIQ